MMQKVKRRFILDSVPVLNKLKEQTLSVKTAFKICKLKKLFEDQLNIFREAMVMPEDVRELEVKKLEILRDCAKKDSNGNPIVHGTSFEMDPEKSAEFNRRITELLTQNPEASSKLEKYYAEMNDFLEEEIEIDFDPIPLEELSELKIAPSDLEIIMFCISQ